jgi:hypothetical protein
VCVCVCVCVCGGGLHHVSGHFGSLQDEWIFGSAIPKKPSNKLSCSWQSPSKRKAKLCLSLFQHNKVVARNYEQKKPAKSGSAMSGFMKR